MNVASNCGFTPQYTALEAIHKKYADMGLVVLGFPWSVRASSLAPPPSSLITEPTPLCDAATSSEAKSLETTMRSLRCVLPPSTPPSAAELCVELASSEPTPPLPVSIPRTPLGRRLT